ncbi:MAG TPA: hypothetical protein VKA70_10290 [Blastocatellia bacterium]|nr:hypothetical protein [Blastocatellia bacterium]
MFEQPKENVEKDRSRLVVIMSGVAVGAVIVLIVLVSSFCKSGGRVEMAGADTDEFKSYVGNIRLTLVENREGERDLGKVVRYARLIYNVTNTGDKTLSGLQLKGKAISLNDEVLRDRVVTVIPGAHSDLKPGETIRVEINMEPIPPVNEIKEFTAEVVGLKLESD